MGRSVIGIAIIFMVFSCSGHKNKGVYSQGRLEYRITYLNAEKDGYDPSFLPKKMTLEFNQRYSINNIDGFMGLFKLVNMTYFNNKKVKTHLKVLNENYSFLGKKNEMMCCFNCLEGIKTTESSETEIIAGLNSKKVKVSFEGSDETYDVFYTTDINLKHPNASNPYKDIKGVLTRFQLIMGPYNMRFDAIKFDPMRPPKEEITIPVKSKDVNRSEMVAILNRLMEQNK